MFNEKDIKLANDAKIYFFDEIDSTNAFARKILDSGEKQSFLVVARSQTGGMGRNGKSFYSPPDSGVYFSVVIHPDLPLADTVCTTTLVSVAVAKAIEGVTGKQVGIKWVNDIYLEDKKVCGILAQAVTKSQRVQSLIIGVGINLCTAHFPADIPNGGSLGVDYSLAPQVIAQVADAIFNISLGGIDALTLDEYRRRSIIIGREIEYFINGEKNTATAIGIDDKGGLIIEKNNRKTVLNSGEISIRF